MLVCCIPKYVLSFIGTSLSDLWFQRKKCEWGEKGIIVFIPPALNPKGHVLDSTKHTQTIQPCFVLLQLEMAVACHRKVLSKVVIIGSAQDVPIGSNYHVATSERTKSRKLEKVD